MERLIDVKAFRQSLEVDRFGCTDIVKVNIALDKSTVDAVEVVRCKDCKHWKNFKHLGCTDFVKVCGLANYMIGENGYCMYGERKDNG